MFDIVKTLKLWQISLLVAVLVGAAGATYGVYALVTGSGESSMGEDQQLIPVQYGDLVNQVSTNGALTFPSREMLTFGTQGTVGTVLVEEGQQVEAGQPLVALDDAAVASLARNVSRARVDLQNAEEALAEASDPHSPLDLAKAEAAVANARLSAQDAGEALGQLGGRHADELAASQTRVDSARTALENALGDLSIARREWEDKVQTAQDAQEAALNSYQDVFEKWLGADTSTAEVVLAPEALLDTLDVDLTLLFDSEQRYVDMDRWLDTQGPPPDDPATSWNEATVYAWLNFFPGPIAPTCDDNQAPFQGACIQRAMDDAWDRYQQADDDLDTVQTQAAKAIANGEEAVTGAEEKLADAEDDLADLSEGPDPLDAEVKEKQMAVAQADLAQAEEELAEMLNGADPIEVALRDAEVASATEELETAIRSLEDSTLEAPMSGIISQLNVEVGQSVNANARIVEIADPTVVEVNAIVDEIDVLFIQEGARATVIMDALPDHELEGAVSEISTVAISQQGVVSYPIRVRLAVPQGVELREGLSATASIVIREELNVLLVPLQTLYGTFEQPLVRVWNNGRTEDRAVTLGNSDDFWGVARDGLVEGEQVVMEAQTTTTGGFGFGGGGALRGLTGGFGGGGRSGGGGGQARPSDDR